MSKYFYFLMITIVTLSCSNSEIMEAPTESEVDNHQAGNNSFLALGDSYTIGENVSYKSNWPNQLIDSLQSNNIPIENLQIIAKTGWTTTNLIDAIDSQQPEKSNLVSLSIGVNNQYRRRPFSIFEDEFNELLNAAIELSIDSSVFVVSIPDYGVTPFGMSNGDSLSIARDIDNYNDYMRQLCRMHNLTFIDVTEISRALQSESNSLTSDNLHPSSYQYSLWVSEMLDEVITVISN